MEDLNEAELNRLLGKIEREMGVGDKVPSGSSPLKLPEMVSTVRQPRGSENVVDLGAVEPRDTNTHRVKKFDARIAKVATTVLFNILDRTVNIQFFGSDTDLPTEPNREFEIGVEFPLAAGDRHVVTTDFTFNWFPWYGVRITPVATPTRGDFRVIVYWQRAMSYA